MNHDDIRPHLDHVFLTADQRMIGDIASDTLFASERFGRLRMKNAVSSLLGPYSTLNIAGRNTFIEFFPDAAPPFPGVRVGLVMSFERVGQSIKARDRFAALGIPFHHELVRRKVEGHDDPQPWYNLIRPDFGDQSPFTLFLSEITPEYFDRLGATRSADGRQTREAYLSAAIRAPHLPGSTFDDLARVSLSLRPARAKSLRLVLDALGYEVQTDDDTLWKGPSGAVVNVVSDEVRAEGLIELGLAIASTEALGNARSFGGSKLEVGQGQAIWRFETEVSQGQQHA